MTSSRLRPCGGMTRTPGSRTAPVRTAAGQSTSRRPSPTGTSAPTREREEGPHRRRAFALLAERGEVVQTDEEVGGVAHRVRVQVAADGHRVTSAQRVVHREVVGEPVEVPPRRRGEPCVEAGGRAAHPRDGHVGGEHAGQACRQRLLGRAVGAPRNQAPRLPVDVGVGDLAACVDARIGPAGDRQPDRFGTAQHRAQRRRQLALDGPASGLRCPPGEVGPIIGEVESNAHDLAHGQRA